MSWFRLITAGCVLAGSLLAQQSYDLVVYGGTAGGVMTAVAGARHGLRTALLEPRAHVGGMATGGLSRTDTGVREVLGGLALEFYYRVGARYEMTRYKNPVAWFYEPKVGESVMLEMLKQAGVTVLFNHRLRGKTGVTMDGNQVVEIATENGQRFRGKVFADCSYEGDLMAQSKVSYTFGREGSAQYGESLAGVRDRTPYHQFLFDVPALDASGKPLPELVATKPEPPGTADKKIQAYNFRIIATNVTSNRLPWPKPAKYEVKRYELLARYLETFVKVRGRSPVFHELTLIAPIPNGKADFNNNGPFSTDFIGKNYAYPDGDYATRDRIWQEHVDYVQGFYYFLANDPRVPEALQKEVNEWGLPRDEYADTSHWPHQLYVREARRMVGVYVASQKDLQTDLHKSDVIGMGSYNSDSHNIQRFVNARGMAENEGDMQVAVKPYQIPFRIILPRKEQARNLLVPVCFSATHVAYSSLRMEPQYMIIGHAAGVASAMAVKAGVAVQDIDVAELQKALKSEAAVFNYIRTPQQDAMEIIHRQMQPKGVGRFNWEY
ncbi:MAG TPA: FAD-dependent oxidoreductase [Bryobacteraceae bacterium]|nr:FAD-dependent oxidoreductase [Bryobacteraceae bacterium]